MIMFQGYQAFITVTERSVLEGLEFLDPPLI